jgi:hypothetical protein
VPNFLDQQKGIASGGIFIKILNRPVACSYVLQILWTNVIMERISRKQKESNVFSLAGSGANLKTSARRGRDDGTDIGTGTVQGPPI